jgi:hypothetical protein
VTVWVAVGVAVAAAPVALPVAVGVAVAAAPVALPVAVGVLVNVQVAVGVGETLTVAAGEPVAVAVGSVEIWLSLTLRSIAIARTAGRRLSATILRPVMSAASPLISARRPLSLPSDPWLATISLAIES